MECVNISIRLEELDLEDLKPLMEALKKVLEGYGKREIEAIVLPARPTEV